MGWEEMQASTRRFPNSRSNRGRRTAFEIRSAFGTYEVKCPGISHSSAERETQSAHSPTSTSSKKAAKGGESRLAKLEGSRGGQDMWMEIHETIGDGRGIIASFEMGELRGVMLIAGSRKVLSEVAAAEDKAHGSGSSTGGSQAQSQNDGSNSSSNDGEEEEEEEEAPVNEDCFEPPPPSMRSNPFEKNTFRTPKFWFRYRARHMESSIITADNPANMGFIEFDGNACRGFKGVISSEKYGENVAFEGWKIKGKGSKARWEWPSIRE